MRLTDEEIMDFKEIAFDHVNTNMKWSNTFVKELIDVIEARQQENEAYKHDIEQLRIGNDMYKQEIERLQNKDACANALTGAEMEIKDLYVVIAKAREALNSVVWECTNKYIEVDENTFYKVSEALTAIDEIGGGNNA